MLRKWLESLDPALALGVAGLAGLGVCGWLVLPLGLLSVPVATYACLALAAVGVILNFLPACGAKPSVAKPDAIGIALLAVVLAALAMATIGAFAPSDTLDWDALAYHLAVPKLWIEHGKVDFISFIHHSNFPFVVDNLFLLGLKSGEAGAKLFNALFLACGSLAIFGLARSQYGARAGWWASAAFATVPTVIWESGTAYIDMAHGLYAGIGAALMLTGRESRSNLWLGALLLGFAVGSKYTGLQAVVATGLVLIPAIGFRTAALACLAAVAVGSPWYVRNVINTGNPVYPFFYSKLGGKNWSDFNAKIYAEEQGTFGVPKSGIDAVGSAVLGLAYQPGRYTNPMPALNAETTPPQGARGLPVAAMGAALFVAGLAWAFSGRAGRFERQALGWVLVTLAMWWALSQQSRYIVTVAPLLAILLGGAAVRLRAGPVVAAVAALQALYSLWLIKTVRTDVQLPVVMGQMSREDYLKQAVSFYEPSQEINSIVKGGRVALYDEVFGFFLDVPYFWANPGHSMEIDYANLADGRALANRFREMGITHVYMNLGVDRTASEKFLEATQKGYSDEERSAAFGDPRTKWRVLVAEAVRDGELRSVQTFRNAMLFEVGR